MLPLAEKPTHKMNFLQGHALLTKPLFASWWGIKKAENFLIVKGTNFPFKCNKEQKEMEPEI